MSNIRLLGHVDFTEFIMLVARVYPVKKLIWVNLLMIFIYFPSYQVVAKKIILVLCWRIMEVTEVASTYTIKHSSTRWPSI